MNHRLVIKFFKTVSCETVKQRVTISMRLSRNNCFLVLYLTRRPGCYSGRKRLAVTYHEAWCRRRCSTVSHL